MFYYHSCLLTIYGIMCLVCVMTRNGWCHSWQTLECGFTTWITSWGVQFLPLIMSCPIPMFCIIHLVEPRHTMITCVLFMRWQRTEMYNRVYHTDITVFISCLHEQLLNKVTSDNKNLVNKRSKDHICEKWILINFKTSLKFEMWK